MIERIRRIPVKQRDRIEIDRALLDPHLLGAALGSPAPWRTWLSILRAAFGLNLSDDDLETFHQVAGDRIPPKQRVRELWAVVGRRGGKSRMAAALAVYQACFVKHTLARGEVGTVLVFAASRDQAKVVFEYIKGFIGASPVLSQEIEYSSATEIKLRSGVVLGTHANSFRSIRGRTLLGVVFDEVALWRDEVSALPDLETYRAVLPALMTTKGMLIGISTPYRRIGLLHQKHKDHFGVDGDDVLVVQGPTVAFNPVLDAGAISKAIAADPEGARAEWEATFRNDISAFLDEATIEAAIDYSRPLELPPLAIARGHYQAFCDASGGVGADAYTIAIGHAEADHFVIDLVRGTTGKFDPNTVTNEYAKLIKEYGIRRVTGDNYASQWVAGAWGKAGIAYKKSELVKSQVYLEAQPMFARGLVRLPDHPKLLRELRLLERRTHRSGKDTVDHGRSGHDDHANAVAGVIQNLSSGKLYNLAALAGDQDIDRADYARERLDAAIFAFSGGRCIP